ncbi:AMP-binding protein, partial [Cognatishimia sp.]|uniref:AMP-binding protein n=1 Tax=Cognatishimia sp. TaxID=2211648 RepID=UPI003514773A
WFSTPSHARKAMLRPDPGRTLPHLRLSMFCGEPLTWGLARKWAGLTAGRLENWYGPSETTIAAARYVLPDTAMEDDGEVVPIGKPIGHMPCAVLQSGELCLGGAQVFDGYLGAARRPNRVYRTGDLVRRGADGTLRFLGRRDGQVKLHGQLVDIPWIEGVIARIAQAETSVLPWPYKVANPDGLVAVLTQSGPVADHVKTRITAALPKHIAPHIVTLPHLPLTPAGKQDVAALAKHVTNALSRQSRRPTRAFDRLVACVHDVNPTLALSDLSQGATLMEAGLDSLAFTAFIARIETEFDLVLTQMDVASLSGMTLRQMVAYLRKTQSRLPLSAGASNPKGTGPLPHRAKRALDFLEKFPAFLQAAHRPIVPMSGSSGFMRGLDSQVVDATLLDLGHDVRAANIGLAMLSNLGLCEICAHIIEVAKSGQTTFPIAVLELEVMHLSVLPPAGDIEVLDAFKSGRRRHEVGDSDDPDTIWASQRAGTLTERQGPWRPRDAPARWESQRHSEMREVFAGNVALDPKAVDIWLASIAHLLQVSDRVAVVLHPLDGQVSHLAKGRGHLAALRSRLQDLHRVVLISDDQFVLEPSHFRNFSHLNERGGRHAFSSQLARHLALHLR